MTTVCLTMIVKDEAHIVARCLRAVRPFIDAWAIVDTGSTDDTVDIVRRELAGIPGQISDAPWENFGAARTRSLELAEGRADYAMIVDADDVWSGTLDKSQLREDAHSVWFTRERDKFSTVRFLRLGRGWRYEGVLHEQPVNSRPFEDRPLVDGLSVTSPNDGSSWQDPQKYLKHARLISAAMVDDPTNTRYAYYLAQSYRDHGDYERAALLYIARAAMGPGEYPEEVYVSLLNAGRCYMRLGRPGDAKNWLLQAHNSYPGRREAMAELGRLFVVMAATMPTVGTLCVEDAPLAIDDEAAQ